MNEDATKALDAYLEGPSRLVPHALLLVGAWGSGKTHFLKNIYEPRRAELMRKRGLAHAPFLFVSLFGAGSAKEVELRIYRTACPGEALAGAIAGTIAVGIAEFFRMKDAAKGAIEKIGDKAVKRINEYVFVFDDVERMQPSAFGEIMGLINSFVADFGRHVIMVADEERIKKIFVETEWKEQNEKIVGRRVRLAPDIEGVIKTPVEALPPGKSARFITDRLTEITRIAELSEVVNLRCVIWGIHNTHAFVDCLSEDPEIPEGHIDRTMAVVMAATLWLRSGRIQSTGLHSLPGLASSLAVRSLSAIAREEPLARDLQEAQKFSEIFESLSVENPPVSYNDIVGFELGGFLNGSELRESVKARFGFGSLHSEAPWRVLWYSRERPRSAIEVAIAETQKGLENYDYKNPGVILHIAGLAIRLNSLNDDRLTSNEGVVPYFKRYIDQIANSDLFEMTHSDDVYEEFGAHDGLGFVSRESDDFLAIRKHIKGKITEKRRVKLNLRSETILSEAESGNFRALLKFADGQDVEMCTQPVLSCIPAERMAKIITRDVPEVNAGAKMLAYRYHLASIGDPVFEEIPWARTLCEMIMADLKKWEQPHGEMAIQEFRGLIVHYERSREGKFRLFPGN
jgi:hypothetical protein